jgi:hypothetical protein
MQGSVSIEAIEAREGCIRTSKCVGGGTSTLESSLRGKKILKERGENERKNGNKVYRNQEIKI